MFWRRKRYDRDALVVMAVMSEQEKIETRCLAVVSLALGREHLHVMTATQESATEHADYIARVGKRLGIEVAQLPLTGPDSARMAAYAAKVVVGPIGEFIANADLSTHTREVIALVEGEPPAAARSMLSGYRAVKIS